ncbi:DUF3662 and FHA domain-containing protein [Candidatus Oleimmundimicrobium sp.]|uniref:DUF3662 and FHA domain-containing protein n=1 Tax=Candidatus Oleimmundimicrobium sp. TaxID=3060597 RepID=UPI0027179507|nr:DUF3662 and FHA domain-containing protein [Candidatus Oleimmundimicrobium sp.]MDO8886815.1 DUF3662 and FHA domain-containing protein [Candidatus Oleimmundimicrobium sp.]
MSLLKEFEKKLGELVEGFFIKQFKSQIQPIEIAKKIAREMSEHKTISVSKIYAPNSFVVYVSSEDKKLLTSFESVLIKELSEFVEANAKKEGFALTGIPQIKIEAKDSLSLGEIEVKSSMIEDAASDKDIFPSEEKKQGNLVPKGASLIISERDEDYIFPLTKEITTIGRLESNDVPIKDASISRVHAEIRAIENNFVLKDLGSTNGTLLNGEKITEAKLADRDVIIMGATSIKFFRRSYV